MTYQVLARKWRPRTFSELVGQEHVVRALVNALDTDRVHHAFLFTGTRGVGKTTLARVFAKALNCQEGVSSEPCGQCSSCKGIDEGRFFDLIEVDAASRTKVDDTRELLENVQYAPTNARYKVYLIDEVHMLSTSSFNALLKTLEEPPPHVKFLLATTDPQKLPVTVLSRCLQFNLKRLSIEQISGYLAELGEREAFESEPEALRMLAVSADGSMRDGLSLLDQALAYGGGKVALDDVQTMLGTVQGQHLDALVSALCARDAAALWQAVTAMIEYAPDFGRVLDELAQLLHRAAITQLLPDAADPADTLAAQLAGALQPADIQLFYQIAINGRRDLDLAPDHRTGFEMTLLRMLAFEPADQQATPPAGQEPPPQAAPTTGRESAREAARRAAYGDKTSNARQQSAPSPSASPLNAEVAEPAPEKAELPTPTPAPAASSPVDDPPGPQGRAPAAAERPVPRQLEQPDPVQAGADAVATLENDPAAADEPCSAPRPAEDWDDVIASLGLRGTAGVLASNSVLSREGEGRYVLALDPAREHLHTPQAEAQIRDALARLFGTGMRLKFIVAATGDDTPAVRRERETSARQSAAEAAIDADPLVQTLKKQLGARVVPGSVRPLDS